MRITAVILLASCLQVSAKSFAQHVTLSEKNVPLQKVFREIHKQTGFQFFFEDELLDRVGKININVKDVTLEEALAICFRDLPLTYTILGKAIVVNQKEEPPKPASPPPLLIDIAGKIMNAKGEPVVATITVKGNTIATTSNEKGEFFLPGVDQNATLVITGVNIETKEVKVSGKTSLAITVNIRVAEGQEVMVTAYGIEKRSKEIGYSAVKVSGEELNRTSPSNLLSGLAGKVSGLNLSTTSAGMNPQIRVLLRGMRSYGENTNNLPLFILNGTPLSFGSDQQSAGVMLEFINNINPNDIESLNILKGANGSALYGPEGVNGVIIITTKKGTAKPQVNFKHSTMLQSIDHRYPKLQKQFGPGNSVDQLGNAVYNPYGTGDNWGPAFNGQMVQIGRPDENGEVQMVPYKYTNERFKFWDIAQTIQNTVSVAQGDSRSDFYLSAGHTYLTGLTPNDRSNRISLLVNAARQFGILNTRINMGYTNTKLDVYPGQPSVLGTPAHIPITSYKDYINNKWADHNHFWADGSGNPYEEIDLTRSLSNSNAFFGNLTITIQPTRWLRINNRTGMNFNGAIDKGTNAPIIYSEFGKTNGRSVSASGDRRASVSDEHRTYAGWSNDLLINSQFKMGIFSLKTTLGNSIRNNLSEKIKTSAGDLLVPVYNIAYNSYSASVTQQRVLSRSYSYFGTGTVGYKDWAFLELTGRQDWDSKIAATARSKNFYYGANTSIVLSEAVPAITKNKILSSLRLRAAVTRTANMNISPYQSEALLTLSSVYANVLSYSYGGVSFPNAFLKPEKVISQEYGLAATLLENRVRLDLTYYRQRNNGVIAARKISVFSGATETTDNVGDFLNHGWEFDLDLNPLFKLPNGLSASVEGMFSVNDNRVLSVGKQEEALAPGGTPGGPTIYTGGGNAVIQAGLPAFTYNIADWLRDGQGRVIVDKTTGLPSIDVNHFLMGGRSLPRYMGSFNFHLYWKRLGLHMVGEYRGGYNHYFRNAGNWVINGTAEATAQYNRQQFVFPNSVYDDGSGKYVTNTDIVVKSAGASYYNLYSQAETNFLVSGAFWKMREIALSYNWPFKINWLKELTVTLAARNLFTLYPKTNRWGDPELTTGAGTVVRDDQKAASNLNGIFSEGSIGGSRFFGFSLNAAF
ncbi:MAG: SusC/RagA family TonB-linked outer membrane protein [Agriterribacter sp.]